MMKKWQGLKYILFKLCVLFSLLGETTGFGIVHAQVESLGDFLSGLIYSQPYIFWVVSC